MATPGTGQRTLDSIYWAKGAPVSVFPLDPEVTTEEDEKDAYGDPTGKKKTTKGPNPTPVYRQVFADKTYVDVRTPAPGANGEPADPEIRGGTAIGQSGPVKDPTAPAPADPAKAPETRTFPDGTERQWDPSANGGKGDWVIIATKPQGPSQSESKPGAPTPLNLPAPRPGQTTDLSLVEAQANQYFASLDADTALTPAQRAEKKRAYVETVVKPQADRATQEANAYAAQREAERQADRQRLERNEGRQDRREDRLVTADERRAAFDREREDRRRQEDERDFGYRAGQDAVSNALKLLPYRVGPSFAGEFARGLGVLSGGGGPVSFSPESFTFDLPDTAALAEQAAQRAAQRFSVSSMGAVMPAQPAAPVASMPVAAQAAPPVDPLASVPMAPRPAVPPVTPANRDLWAR